MFSFPIRGVGHWILAASLSLCSPLQESLLRTTTLDVESKNGEERVPVCVYCVSYLKISKVALSRETHWIAHFAFLVKMSTLLKPGVERGKLSFFLSFL